MKGRALDPPLCLRDRTSPQDGRPRRRSALPVALLLLAGLALQGCAKFPENAQQIGVRRQMAVDFQVAGRINPAYYYFIAIDTQGGGPGPEPVVISGGNGWGTGSITHFVQYHLVFDAYRMREDTNLIHRDPIAPPLDAYAAGNTIHVLLILDDLGLNLGAMDLNLITTDRLNIEPSFEGTNLYDALGTGGRGITDLRVDYSHTVTDSPLNPEPTGDKPPQYTGPVNFADLDITDWTVNVRVN